MITHFTQSEPLPPQEEFYIDGLVADVYSTLGAPITIILLVLVVVIVALFLNQHDNFESE